MRILAILLSLVALTIAAIAAPDEELLGKSAGYPIGTPGNWFFDEGVWVGSFSNLNKILPHNTHKKTASPLRLPAADEPKIEYWFRGRTYTLDDFLSLQRITGPL